jgi:hypothetical protein
MMGLLARISEAVAMRVFMRLAHYDFAFNRNPGGVRSRWTRVTNERLKDE